MGIYSIPAITYICVTHSVHECNAWWSGHCFGGSNSKQDPPCNECIREFIRENTLSCCIHSEFGRRSLTIYSSFVWPFHLCQLNSYGYFLVIDHSYPHCCLLQSIHFQNEISEFGQVADSIYEYRSDCSFRYRVLLFKQYDPNASTGSVG